MKNSVSFSLGAPVRRWRACRLGQQRVRQSRHRWKRRRNNRRRRHGLRTAAPAPPEPRAPGLRAGTTGGTAGTTGTGARPVERRHRRDAAPPAPPVEGGPRDESGAGGTAGTACPQTPRQCSWTQQAPFARRPFHPADPDQGHGGEDVARRRVQRDVHRLDVGLAALRRERAWQKGRLLRGDDRQRCLRLRRDLGRDALDAKHRHASHWGGGMCWTGVSPLGIFRRR